jgi:glycerol-3-phosphate dehydrogenase
MTRDLSRLTSAPFDVLVIGGGIHGLAVAYDAAQRGYSVALVEGGDFGSGSSFNHAKTVHGGLRSLQSCDVFKARFSVRERRAMARIAPHLVTPLAFVMATTRKLTRSKMALRAGFLADALIGIDRNAGVERGLRLPAGRVIPRDSYRALFGANASAEATGGARWTDYHMPESDRLTLAFAQAACLHGAVLANYLEALDPLVGAGRVAGIRAVDRLNGTTIEIAARVTVNTAGAYCRPWMAAFGAKLDFPLLKAMNLVTTRPAGPVAMGAPTSGGRLLLIMPWHGRILVGTSHSDSAAEPGDSTVSQGELASFVDEVNSAFPALALRADEVSLVHRGVVPAVPDRRGVLGLMGHHRVHDHRVDGIEGAVSVVGVKYTTGRGVAEQVVDLIGRKLGRPAPPCRTGTTRLPGAGFDSVRAETDRARSEVGRLLSPESIEALVATHGTDWRAVADLCRTDAELAEPIARGIALPRAVVHHAVQHEMACTLADIVVRRTSLGAAGYPGDAVIDVCGALMARACLWDSDRLAREIEIVKAFYRLV